MRIFIVLLVMAMTFGVNINQNTGQLDFITKSHAADSKEAEGVHPEFQYHEMKPLMIPVINNGGISQQVSFVVTLEIPYGELDKITLYEPRLADAYIQDLYGVLGTGYGLINGSVLDVPTIKSRLKTVAQHVLGDEALHDVLLQVVQQRQL